ncbi:MAG: carboxypeptidase M32 [Pirellulaceae bacterium]|nr:carboxypeptidase M32 [Pirellulaceae bacterium]
MSQSTWDQLTQHTRETGLLSSTLATLEWDERTGLPPEATAYRAEQQTYLAGLIHQRSTADELDAWLTELAVSDLGQDPHSDTGATIRLLRRNYDRCAKLPQTLVEEITRASVLGQQAWVSARSNNSFHEFQPYLETLVGLKQQEADAVGYDECRYDALLDEFEPGAKAVEVAKVLDELKEALVPLVQAVGESTNRSPAEILHRDYPTDRQRKLGRRVASKIGFDFRRGRIDETDHPFCTNLGPNDCRITTRYDEWFFSSAVFGTLHEAGHGLYEQGLRPEFYALPPGQFTSLGIHESQSRLWENFVGRSAAFWQYFYPMTRDLFPAALSDVTADEFHFAVNDVRPSLIRVEADEATYNLHIVIRFELEQLLLNGDLSVTDLPDAWNEKYQNLLGIKPSNDAEGVLQDIHWSGGAIGYFPTYALGNLYAAQFFAQAGQDLGDLDAMFAEGEFRSLSDWLRTNIHQAGSCYSASELVQRVTGQPLSHQPLIDHLYRKLGPLYGVS